MKNCEYIKEVKYGDRRFKVKYLQEAERKNQRDGGEVTIAYVNLDDTVVIAKAGRKNDDVYNEAEGKQVAGKRLIRRLKKYYKLSNPQ